MEQFLRSFVSIFVAVDAVGLLPLFIGLTEGLPRPMIKRVIVQSVITASLVTVTFIFLGPYILSLLTISPADFMIAGGALLFLLSISDVLSSEDKHRFVDTESLGAVPLGVPLMAGPALLTTSLILINEQGPFLTVSSALVNILFAGGIFWMSDTINRILGKNGAKTFSKIAELLLATIGVMMIRRGIMTFIGM